MASEQGGTAPALPGGDLMRPVIESATGIAIIALNTGGKVTLRDRAGRKRAEKLLHEGEARFRILATTLRSWCSVRRAPGSAPGVADKLEPAVNADRD